MSDLAVLQCVPCKGGTLPLRGAGLVDLLARLGNDWRVVEGHHLEKEFRFKDFREALEFTNGAGPPPRHLPGLGEGPADRLDSQDRWPDRERLRLRSQVRPGDLRAVRTELAGRLRDHRAGRRNEEASGHAGT
jgi:hypothetical protein